MLKLCVYPYQINGVWMILKKAVHTELQKAYVFYVFISLSTVMWSI